MVVPNRQAVTKGGENRDAPIYTIGTVCRETGLNPATVRTWEDRYGRIVPSRDTGGRRLYSRRQIEDLRWLTQRVESGLQPSEAHRLLDERTRSSAEGVPSLSLVTADGPAVLFGRWVDGARDVLAEKLWLVRERIDALSVDLVLNYSHPVFGLTRSTIIRATDDDRAEDVHLARFVAVSWAELPEVRSTLAAGNVAALRFDQMDDVARNLFEPTDIRSVLMAPVIVDDVWCGLIEATADDEREWSDEAASMLERAVGLVLSMYQAYSAESDFSHLFDER